MNVPLVTVIMPVYNAEAYVAEAVQSILGQTLREFELLVIDDGSADKSVEIVNGMKDSRIRLGRNEKNLGLIATLNKGLELATGKYIARMDADDISLPSRLEKQAKFLEAHPEVGVLGTRTVSFGGGKEKINRYLPSHGEIMTLLLFNSALSHPSVMFRRGLPGLHYDPAFIHAEDYDLWTRLSEVTQLANYPEVLLRYRVHAMQVTQKENHVMRSTAGTVRFRQLKKLGIFPSPEEAELHDRIGNGHHFRGTEELPAMERWLLRLIEANKEKKIYPEPFFSHYLAQVWLYACGNSGAGIKAYRIATHSPLMEYADAGAKTKLKLLVKSIIR